MKILFWGTPDYAVPTMVALHQAGHTLVGVVTQPDRRRGRGKTLIPSPVKATALELGLKVFTPQRIKQDESCQKQLAELQADLSVVVAFGQILPTSVLNQPPLGCWNGHGSLLPRWRGAGPIQWSLMEGDSETGVGVMAMEEGLDTGPVLLERRLSIGLCENAYELSTRLSHLTALLMVEAIPLIKEAGTGTESERWEKLGVMPQANNSSYARMLGKEDFKINWNQSALTIHRKVMGLYPGATTNWKGKKLKVIATEPLIKRLSADLSHEAAELTKQWGLEPGAEIDSSLSPGQILEVVTDLGVIVATRGCPLLIREAQIEGKKRASGKQLLQQLQINNGDQFGT
ncbi:methionyl-tRNA formyltransferase [Synechococcus sp. SYN20]|uniref:methionyl-tRNA formyltransferase n=1 Tax=Synechococcus sp. SYN20 TaxID=1050714 RepID=UPI001646684B|nr:methionyl-tRNA formyltransferase [Synechococcus sp. SYN20]QNJ25851.1 methionyl-tRNA formyltransferase [Synechococcus sp. SYN20]